MSNGLSFRRKDTGFQMLDTPTGKDQNGWSTNLIYGNNICFRPLQFRIFEDSKTSYVVFDRLRLTRLFAAGP